MPDDQNLLTTPDSSYVLDDQVGFLLRLAGQRHTTIFQSLIPEGLTATQFAALIRLTEMGACSQNELGRKTAMDVATIKGVVDRLRKKGLVIVQTDPNDKRRTMLSVAPDKLYLMSALQAAGLRISQETLAPLDAKERATFLALLRKISEP